MVSALLMCLLSLCRRVWLLRHVTLWGLSLTAFWLSCCWFGFSEVPGPFYEMSSFPETKAEKFVNKNKAKFFLQYPLCSLSSLYFLSIVVPPKTATTKQTKTNKSNKQTKTTTPNNNNPFYFSTRHLHLHLLYLFSFLTPSFFSLFPFILSFILFPFLAFILSFFLCLSFLPLIFCSFVHLFFHPSIMFPLYLPSFLPSFLPLLLCCFSFFFTVIEKLFLLLFLLSSWHSPDITTLVDWA